MYVISEKVKVTTYREKGMIQIRATVSLHCTRWDAVSLTSSWRVELKSSRTCSVIPPQYNSSHRGPHRNIIATWSWRVVKPKYHGRWLAVMDRSLKERVYMSNIANFWELNLLGNNSLSWTRWVTDLAWSALVRSWCMSRRALLLALPRVCRSFAADKNVSHDIYT